MAWTIAFVSQKGGCGKSTLSRLFAQQFVAGELTAIIADMDHWQGTSTKWAAIRAREGLTGVDVVACSTVQEALRAGKTADVLVIDGRAFADKQTLEVAKASDLVVLPTGPSPDDLEPSVLLAHDLVQAGIERNRIRFALFRVEAGALAETRDARDYIMGGGYEVFAAVLPRAISYYRAMAEGCSPAETVNPLTGQPYERLNQAAIDLADEMAGVLLDLA